MGCYRISDKAKILRKMYFDKFEKKSRGWYYKDDETLEEYEKYLEKEINK